MMSCMATLLLCLVREAIAGSQPGARMPCLPAEAMSRGCDP